MSGAGRGVTPGAESDAGPDEGAESPVRDQGQAASSDTGPVTARGASGEPATGTPEKAGTGDAAEASGEGAAQGPGSADSPGSAEPSGPSGPSGSAGSAASGAAGRRTAAGRKGKRGARFLRELVILVAIALVIAVAIKTYAIQAFFIPSGSMENTLEINDRVLVNKIVYDLRGIHRGDIVVFNGDGSWDPGSVPTSSNFAEEFFSGFASMFGFGRPGDILIKRVIGLPGDDVACCDAQGRVTVNGVPLNEQSYLYPGDVPSDIRFNIVVPPGRLWVMGDHRLISDDSRDHEGDPGGGTVPESAVLGRAFVIIWPPSRWRILPIPATFEQSKLSALAAGSPASAAAASASTAGLLSARLEPSSPALPLSLGFAAAIPVSWLQRRVRTRITLRRAARHAPGPPAT
jgi:signal peptidase I